VRLSVDRQALRPGVDFITDPASGRSEGHFDLVHVKPVDLLTSERRSITYGVIIGRAVYLDLPATSDHDTLAMYDAWQRELVRNAPVIRKGSGKLTWSVADEQYRHALLEVM